MKKPEFTVTVAWSREASDILEEKGIKALCKAKNIKKGYDWDEYYFDTISEAFSFKMGINLCQGWDCPACNIDLY